MLWKGSCHWGEIDENGDCHQKDIFVDKTCNEFQSVSSTHHRKAVKML